jgi:hypothetical protein
VPVDVYSKQLGRSDIKTTQIYMGAFRPSSSPELRSNVTCARLKARNAKAEQELAKRNRRAKSKSHENSHDCCRYERQAIEIRRD